MSRPARLVLPLALVVGLACGGPPTREGPVLKDMPFVTLRRDDFAVHPRIGVELGRRHLVVLLRADADDAALRAALAAVGGALAGLDAALRLAFVQLPEGTGWEGLDAALATLAAHPAVESVTLDPVLEPAVAPPPRDGQVGHRSVNWMADGGWNWGLKAIGAPQAWNLVPFLRALEAEQPRRVSVGVIDTSFNAHPDLAGVFSFQHRALGDGRAAEAWVTDIPNAHGTFVAGQIGALWNGQHVDGVVPQPFIRVLAAYDSATGDVAADLPESFGVELARAAELLARADASLRVINASLGFNWVKHCFPKDGGARCDPREGAHVADARCDDADVRLMIRQSGRAFAAFTARVNATRKILFVVSAGNDSGGASATIDACGLIGVPRLGQLPAAFASPMANAGLEQRDINTLVVGSHDATADAAGPVTESWFSDVGAHMLAPGDRVGGLTGDAGSWTTDAWSGTSMAAPFVAGAAAYLHLLDPRLDNRELRRLLTLNVVSVADPRGAPTQAEPALHLGRAVARMEVLLPGGATVPGERLLADLDDGSEDGFTRATTGPAPTKSYRDVQVDMADMRAFRDMWWLTRNDPAARIVCPSSVAGCDLNRDGGPRLRPLQEPYARAALTGRDVDEAALAVLQRHFTGGPRQRFGAADLPALLRSADLEVQAQAFLGRALIAGATGATIELLGEGPATTAAALRGLPLTNAPAVLTTPLLRAAAIRVTAGGRVFEAALGDLAVAEDRAVHLNPCVWDDDQAGLLDPPLGGCDGDHPDDSPFRPRGDAGRDIDADADAGAWPPRGRGDIDASSAGDPHIKTWDGLLYDFQGVGEFVLARDGQREVQARQTAVPGATGVSVNAAVAVRVGASRLELRRGERSRVWLDGQPRDLVAPLALPDADLSPGPGSILVTWKDGDRLGVVVHDDALDLYPVFKRRSDRALAGLWGPTPDGDPENDLVGRDGAVRSSPSARALHREYGHSWRVSADESLFTYAPGESTATFTDADYPAAPGSVADLSPAAYAAAHARCVAAQIRQPALLEACILDVARLGRDSAAWSFRGISDPRATWSPAIFRSDFEAEVPPQWIHADPASVLRPPRGRTGGPAPSWFYGPFPPALAVEKSPTLYLPGLGEHDAVAIGFDLIALGEWRGNAADAAVVELRDLALRPVLRTTYATGDARQAFPGGLPGGDFPAGTGALARDLSGPEPLAAYRHRVVLPHVDDMLILSFHVHGGGRERWGLDNVEITTLRDPASTIEPVGVGDGVLRVVHGPAVAPALAGCADGTREAFHDRARAPAIAGCLAAWDGARSLADAATGAACGDGLPACAAPADACAADWHLCRADDLRRDDPLRCLNAGVGQYLAAASICADEAACGAADACLSEGTCAPAVCCGTMCARPETCDDGVWPDLTWRTQDACGAIGSNPLRGVLCCRDP